MRVVYLDVLLALNFGMDYCILRAAAALGGRTPPVWRLSLAAGFGALYAGGCVLLPMLAALPMRLTVCAVMAGTAFAVRTVRALTRQTLLVLLVSFLFGGAVLALEELSGTQLTENGVLCAAVSRRVLLGAAGLAYGLSCLIFRGQAKPSRPHGEEIRLTYRGKTAILFLLVDSGNTLCDPLTGRPVLVLTQRAAARILPAELYALVCDAADTATLLRQLRERGINGWQLVPFGSVGGEGLLPCFLPEDIRRADGTRYDALAAISGTDDMGEFDGLIEP